MRHAIHVFFSAIMWGVFAYYWYVVLEREIEPSTIRAMLYLLAAIVVGLATTMLWIRHNVRLARKFAGRRRAPRPMPDPDITLDTIGRAVSHPGLEAMRQASIIDIAASDTSKAYIIPNTQNPVPPEVQS